MHLLTGNLMLGVDMGFLGAGGIYTLLLVCVIIAGLLIVAAKNIK